jgi:tRNA threonylcarbamoyladenosine biosynthesis protein TsaE
MRTIEIKSLNHLHIAAREFLAITKGSKKFAFYGPLGSGKTTIIQAICKELGACNVATSPSFSLVNEYRTNSGNILYHFDLFRINTIDELYDLGYEEYFYGESYVFIEWPDKAEPLLPDSFIKVYLEEIDKTGRKVHLSI